MKFWNDAALSKLTTKVGSGATPLGGESAYKPQGTPLIRSMNVVFFGFKRSGLVYLDEQQAKALAGATVEAGDVLLNITGASIGRVTLAPADMAGARVNQHVCIIRPNAAIDARYLAAYLSNPSVQSKIWADNTGTTRQALTKQQILSFSVPLAPLAEQRRIADKLDTVLARVDAVNERLARVAPLLKRLRQSVLTAATSGRLTEDWRLQNGGSESTPLALGSLVVSIDQGWSPKCEPTAAPPGRWAVIKTTAIQPLMFLPDENKELPESLEPRPNLALEDGDVLITRAGPRSRAGIACIVRGAHPRLMLCDKAYRVRVDQSKICSDMLNLLLNSPSVLDAIDQMKTGISESGVNLTQTKFRELRLEVPPIEEQTEIVRRVELLFAYADRLEARLRAAHTAAERLTPALLAKAFRGELVPQDPNDEPAAQLLQRLQASQATAAPQRRKARAAPVVQDVRSNRPLAQ